MENLARCIIRASFSQERLSYDAKTATVIYKGKDEGKDGSPGKHDCCPKGFK
jgi:hypothetical protein